MSEKPILFTGPMVQAILQGRKTQTRRVVKSPVSVSHNHMPHDPMIYHDGCWLKPNEWSPYGRPGDTLWVREKWQAQNIAGKWWHEVPSAERMLHNWAFTNPGEPAYDVTPPRWLPSIHMPRMACRVELEIVQLRIERLQMITENAAAAEGVSGVRAYAALWDSINEGRGYSWDSDPWVWVIEFARKT